MCSDETAKLNKADSPKDCTAVTYTQCSSSSGKVRNSDGVCVSAQPSSCASACTEGGTFNVGLGLCECANSLIPVDLICNITCRNMSPTITLLPGGVLRLTTVGGATTTVSFDKTTGFAGKLADCPNGTSLCTAVTVVTTHAGIDYRHSPHSIVYDM